MLIKSSGKKEFFSLSSVLLFAPGEIIGFLLSFVNSDNESSSKKFDGILVSCTESNYMNILSAMSPNLTQHGKWTLGKRSFYTIKLLKNSNPTIMRQIDIKLSVYDKKKDHVNAAVCSF